MDENMNNGVEEVKDQDEVVVYDMEPEKTSKVGTFVEGALVGAALGLIPMGIKFFKNRKARKKEKLAKEVEKLGGVAVFSEEPEPIDASDVEIEDVEE